MILFQLELPDAIEVQETVEAASVIPFSPASKTSLELSPNHENDFSVPSVFPSFCPFVENLESPVTDESSLGVPDDSPLFFIPEAENEEESAMVEDLSEEMCLDETFEVGLESVGSIDGYIGDQCLQMVRDLKTFHSVAVDDICLYHTTRSQQELLTITYSRTVTQSKSVENRLRKAYNWLKDRDLIAK